MGGGTRAFIWGQKDVHENCYIREGYIQSYFPPATQTRGGRVIHYLLVHTMLFLTLRQHGSSRWRMAMRHCRYTTASCPASSAAPLQPDRPIGYVSLVDQQVAYDKGLDIQTFLVNRRHQINREGDNNTGDPEDIIVFLQHPHTYTAGRRIRGKTELEQEQRLRRLGADYFEVLYKRGKLIIIIIT